MSCGGSNQIPFFSILDVCRRHEMTKILGDKYLPSLLCFFPPLHYLGTPTWGKASRGSTMTGQASAQDALRDSMLPGWESRFLSFEYCRWNGKCTFWNVTYIPSVFAWIKAPMCQCLRSFECHLRDYTPFSQQVSLLRSTLWRSSVEICTLGIWNHLTCCAIAGFTS